MRTVTLIKGDGIGPEVSDAVVEILAAAKAPLVFEEVVVGQAALDSEGDPLPARALESIRRNGVALKGPVATPVGKGFASINVRLRKTLDLYANLRPVKNLPDIESRFQGVDVVVVRENTEDLYSGLEHMVVPGVVESLKIITEKASTRIARFAFEYARRHGRKLVTAIHKANIMKLSDGLFLECFRRVAQDYPDIARRRPDRGRGVHAAGHEPGGLRRDAAREPLRRHHVGPRRGARRRARPRPGSQSRARPRRSSRRSTERRPTSPARTGPTRRRSSSRRS